MSSASEPRRGALTTHVLDTSAGRPAEGVAIDLFRLEGERREHVVSVRTDADGRAGGPILEGDAFRLGVYELVFHVGAYFAAAGVDLPDPPFLDVVPVRFGIAAEDQHYHVPLLIAPFAFSTYRGS